MTTVKLIHQYTPLQLKAVSEQLEQLLSEANPDDEILLKLVSERDVILTACLSQMDTQAREAFVKAELVSNRILTEKANNLLKASLSDLTKHIKTQKAVKQYK